MIPGATEGYPNIPIPVAYNLDTYRGSKSDQRPAPPFIPTPIPAARLVIFVKLVMPRCTAQRRMKREDQSKVGLARA